VPSRANDVAKSITLTATSALLAVASLAYVSHGGAYGPTDDERG
jgi:hypothetical protein